MSTQTFNRIREHSADNIGDGTDEAHIQSLESAWGVKLPDQYRQYLLKIGYAELFGDEIASIYAVPDELPCLGLHWINKDNEFFAEGMIRFFSSDIDGIFYIDVADGKVYLNSKELLYANSFVEFINRYLDK